MYLPTVYWSSDICLYERQGICRLIEAVSGLALQMNAMDSTVRETYTVVVGRVHIESRNRDEEDCGAKSIDGEPPHRSVPGQRHHGIFKTVELLYPDHYHYNLRFGYE